jgi:hypothetical protein
MPAAIEKMEPRRGRPRKFAAPSRAVTVTLPEHVIETLAGIDHDLGRAIVRLTQSELAKQPHSPAELEQFGSLAVILINPSRTLEQQTGVRLVPLPDGRALISFDAPVTIPALELRLADLADDPRVLRDDRATFKAIADILRTARRSNDIEMHQRSIIVLEARKPRGDKRRKRPKPPARRIKAPA